jgi:hypothetical protein
MTRSVRAVTQPGGRNVDWERVGAVASIIGAATVILGFKARSWRYMRTAATGLAISAAVAAHLKNKYAGTSQAPDSE